MAEELQQLLEKIQHDGVDKANAEAAKILAKAKADATAIVQDANAKAAAAKAQAAADAKANAARAEETIRQAARDTVLGVQDSVTRLLAAILTKDVNAAMNAPATVAPLAITAVKALVNGSEDAVVAASSKLTDALRAQLAAAAVKGVTVITDETVQSGFAVRLDNGRVEHAFTGAAVADALSKRLRPALAALVKAPATKK